MLIVTRLPPRLVAALCVLVVILGLIVLVLAVLPRYGRLPLSHRGRIALTGAVALVLAALAGWIVLVLPAYWD